MKKIKLLLGVFALTVALCLFLIPTKSTADESFDCHNVCKDDGTKCVPATMGCFCGKDC